MSAQQGIGVNDHTKFTPMMVSEQVHGESQYSRESIRLKSYKIGDFILAS